MLIMNGPLKVPPGSGQKEGVRATSPRGRGRASGSLISNTNLYPPGRSDTRLQLLSDVLRIVRYPRTCSVSARAVTYPVAAMTIATRLDFTLLPRISIPPMSGLY